MASFKEYMKSEPRAMLSKASNDGTSRAGAPHPMPEDAGNWTGCSRGRGQLVGTFRDVSACMLSAHLGRPATEADLLALTLEDVHDLFQPIWESMQLNQINDQQLANLVMHIRLHYGNTHIAQKGLNDLGENLVVDGVHGPNTRAALQRQAKKNSVIAYNAIQSRLAENYSQSNPLFRAGFEKITKEYFPAREDTKKKIYAILCNWVADNGHLSY